MQEKYKTKETYDYNFARDCAQIRSRIIMIKVMRSDRVLLPNRGQSANKHRYLRLQLKVFSQNKGFLYEFWIFRQ